MRLSGSIATESGTIQGGRRRGGVRAGEAGPNKMPRTRVPGVRPFVPLPGPIPSDGGQAPWRSRQVAGGRVLGPTLDGSYSIVEHMFSQIGTGRKWAA